MSEQNSAVSELQRLTALAQETEAQLVSARSAAVSELKASLKTQAEAAGYTIEELFFGKGKGKSGKKQRSSGVEWRNPNDPNQTWCGIGKRPQWVKDLLAAGTTEEQMKQQ